MLFLKTKKQKTMHNSKKILSQKFNQKGQRVQQLECFDKGNKESVYNSNKSSSQKKKYQE